tara:strand:- start:4861 stop:5109 length:249 start_codon:yes stop_codon:yes gene_type:complete
MSLKEEDGKMYLEVQGEDFEFDEALMICLNTKTGKWVLKTKLAYEAIVDLLEDIKEVCEDQATDPHPDINIHILPSPTKDWN